MKLFNHAAFRELEANQIQKIKERIANTEVGENLEETAKEYVEIFSIPKFKFLFENYTTNISLKNVPVDRNMGQMSDTGWKTIAVVDYTISRAGSISTIPYLGYRPSNHHVLPINVEVETMGEIVLKFSIPTNYSRVDLSDEWIKHVANEKEKIFNAITQTANFINADIDRFNNSLYNEIFDLLNEKKEKDDKMKEIKSRL